jgi:disulfide bond formation protein DsbB
MMTAKPIKPANAAFAAAFLMFAALCGAWYFQYVLKYVPCPLCYEQRIPYYFAIPLGLLVGVLALYGARKPLIRYGLYLLTLVLLVSVGMGVYHAGIEWSFWQGPTSCAAGAPSSAPVGNILDSIRNIRAVPCNEAAWRLFGISLAGYNALVSAGAALIAFAGARRA